jgi:hypothetical protein
VRFGGPVDLSSFYLIINDIMNESKQLEEQFYSF